MWSRLHNNAPIAGDTQLAQAFQPADRIRQGLQVVAVHKQLLQRRQVADLRGQRPQPIGPRCGGPAVLAGGITIHQQHRISSI